MRDWQALKARYMRDPVPVRLGGVSANLARVRSFSLHQNQDEFVKTMIDESKHFLEWTILDASSEAQSDLVDLQIQLAVWERNWELIWQDSDLRAVIANMAGQWSDRVLELSGLLNENQQFRT